MKIHFFKYELKRTLPKNPFFGCSSAAAASDIRSLLLFLIDVDRMDEEKGTDKGREVATLFFCGKSKKFACCCSRWFGDAPIC